MTNTYRRPVKPAPKPCPDCGRKVLTGLDGRVAALEVTIDADILTREGELVFIVTGVKMYATNMHLEIIHRRPAEVLKHPRTLNMHRVHDCDNPTPESFIAPPLPKPTAAPISEEVPF